LRRFFEWITLDVGCGYGTKPLNILFISLATLVIFAAFFCMFPEAFSGPDYMKNKDFGAVASFVTSFKAFTGAEVGEWHPRADYNIITLVMMMESFLGIFITTVLVVTFSRKVIR
jgi:hypothetical protein